MKRKTIQSIQETSGGFYCFFFMLNWREKIVEGENAKDCKKEK
ncbi:hypothetical protein SpAn4DRAFT_2040 [Sporomusa ovata]|uniref:Uncharacterized protein n=1 Tax=Sporomusa ovata TaxID=2378 RepID=A0A0U1KUI4_9FIRM|nr:hypothetical protein SpAn4DRAFT_2040 [Sporomusa ovata]